MNRFTCNSFGRTPFEGVHGRTYPSPLVEVSQHVQHLVDQERSSQDPHYRGAELAPRWGSGLWLGRLTSDNSHGVLMFGNEGVIKVGCIRRVVVESRWSCSKALRTMLATPLTTTACQGPS